MVTTLSLKNEYQTILDMLGLMKQKQKGSSHIPHCSREKIINTEQMSTRLHKISIENIMIQTSKPRKMTTHYSAASTMGKKKNV